MKFIAFVAVVYAVVVGVLWAIYEAERETVTLNSSEYVEALEGGDDT